MTKISFHRKLESQSDHKQQTEQLELVKRKDIDSIFYMNTHKLIWNNITIIAVQFLKAFFLLQVLLVFYSIDQANSSNFATTLLLNIQKQQSIYRTCQIIILLQKAILLSSLFFSRKNNKSNHFLQSMSAPLIEYFHVVSQLDLMLSTCLLLLRFLQNIPGFSISVFICLFSNIYLQNYTNRKEPFYCFNPVSNFIYRCIIISTLFINSFINYLGSQLMLCFFNCLLCVFLLAWYFLCGHKLYIHRISKICLTGVVTIYTTLNISILKKFFLNQEIFGVKQIFKLLITALLVASLIIIYNNLPKLVKNQVKSKEQYNVKEADIYLTSLLQSSFLNKDQDSLLLGMFNFHEAAECTNVKCSSWRLHAYDPILKKRVNLGQNGRQKDSSLRFYLRCVYQRAIADRQRDKKILIDYCQFILAEFGNVFNLTNLFQQLQKQQLNIFQRVKLYKMKLFLKQQQDIFNNQLFQGKLQLEQIITAEDHYQNIIANVSQLSRRNLQIWGSMRKDDVNLSQLKLNITYNFQLSQVIDSEWMKIRKHFNTQKQWLFYYLNYIFFIRNEKLKQREIDQCDFFNAQTPYFSNENSLTNSERCYLLDSAILFDDKTFYLRTFMEEKQMYICGVSKNFQQITKFSKSQVIGSHLNALLGPDLKEIHDSKVSQYLQLGKSSSEQSYLIRFTQCVTREGKIIPLIKYYKVFINITSSHLLQFVGLLKLNKKTQIKNKKENSSLRSSDLIVFEDVQEQFKQKESQLMLKRQANIFMKELNILSKQENKQILQTKKLLRILTFSLLLLIIILCFVTQKQAFNLNNHSIKYLNFLNMYRFPMALVKNYMKYFLNVGNQTKVMNQIGSATKSFQGFASAPLTLQTLFDVSLNVPAMYFPHKNNSVNKGMSYDQIDLFYLIASSISSLNKFPINRTGYDFIQLNEYIKPSYDTIINGTKNKFHESLQQTFTKMKTTQIIIGIIQGFAFIIIIVFIYHRIFTYFSKMKQAMQIIIELNMIDLRKICDYWKTITIHFEIMGLKNKKIKQPTSDKFSKNLNKTLKNIELDNKEFQTINMNKKTKQIYQSNGEKNKTKGIISVIVVAMILIFFIVLSIEMSSYTIIASLSKFQMAGYYFLQYFPATSILGHAILQKYYSYVYPKQIVYNPNRFADALEDMRMIGQYSFIGDIEDYSSQYFRKQKVYMFGSACEFGPDVLIAAQTTLAKCMTMSNKTFTTGVTSFVRMGYNQVSDYIYGRKNMTVTQLDELSTSLTMTAYFITDAITTWATEFGAQINNFENLNLKLSVAIGLFILLLHLVICQWLMFKGLEKDYNFMRKIFDSMIPEYLLIQDKVLRQKFVMEGIINHQ